GDGNLTDGDVSILLGQNDGTYQEVRDGSGQPLRLPVGINPFGLVAGDFNGDGVPDLAVASRGDPNSSDVGPSIAVFLGTGDGSFRPGPSVAADATDGLVTGDFNGDDFLDLASGDRNAAAVSIFLGDGHGAFSEIGYQGEFAAGGNPRALVVGDFDRDGRLD